MSSIPNLDEQIQFLERQKQMIEAAQHQRMQPPQPKKLIWDEIDSEVSPLTNEQKAMLFQNEEYADILQIEDMNPSEKGQFVDRLKDYDNKSMEHFNESYAKYIVSKMWHTDDRKCMGEKYDMLMAKEVCERYRGMVPSAVTYSDVYIAINSQYHDYHCLFKKWFGEDVDYKIIESAIRYWFKDEDYGSSKLWDHFKDK